MGYFWGVEHRFRSISGVIDAEAVRLTFDPVQVTYAELLDLFWALHDPTQINRQGPNIGSQYRSAVFFHSAGTIGQVKLPRKCAKARIDISLSEALLNR